MVKSLLQQPNMNSFYVQQKEKTSMQTQPVESNKNTQECCINKMQNRSNTLVFRAPETRAVEAETVTSASAVAAAYPANQ